VFARSRTRLPTRSGLRRREGRIFVDGGGNLAEFSGRLLVKFASRACYTRDHGRNCAIGDNRRTAVRRLPVARLRPRWVASFCCSLGERFEPTFWAGSILNPGRGWGDVIVNTGHPSTTIASSRMVHTAGRSASGRVARLAWLARAPWSRGITSVRAASWGRSCRGRDASGVRQSGSCSSPLRGWG
jgi:hypothetical protein